MSNKCIHNMPMHLECYECSKLYEEETTGILREQTTKFESGFTRVSFHIPPYHLICPAAMYQLALICAEGVRKHKDPEYPNIEMTTARHKAPLDDLVKHMLNHLNLWQQGNLDENHLAKVMWTCQQIIHQERDCHHYDMYLK